MTQDQFVLYDTIKNLACITFASAVVIIGIGATGMMSAWCIRNPKNLYRRSCRGYGLFFVFLLLACVAYW